MSAAPTRPAALAALMSDRCTALARARLTPSPSSSPLNATEASGESTPNASVISQGCSANDVHWKRGAAGVTYILRVQLIKRRSATEKSEAAATAAQNGAERRARGASLAAAVGGVASSSQGASGARSRSLVGDADITPAE